MNPICSTYSIHATFFRITTDRYKKNRINKIISLYLCRRKIPGRNRANMGILTNKNTALH